MVLFSSSSFSLFLGILPSTALYVFEMKKDTLFYYLIWIVEKNGRKNKHIHIHIFNRNTERRRRRRTFYAKQHNFMPAKTEVNVNINLKWKLKTFLLLFVTAYYCSWCVCLCVSSSFLYSLHLSTIKSSGLVLTYYFLVRIFRCACQVCSNN